MVTLGALLIGHRLVVILLRNALHRIEVLGSGQRPARQPQDTSRGDQGQFGLNKVRAVDREQRLALLDVIAHLGEQGDDPALIVREDLRFHVLVEVNAADGLVLHGKHLAPDRADLE